MAQACPLQAAPRHLDRRARRDRSGCPASGGGGLRGHLVLLGVAAGLLATMLSLALASAIFLERDRDNLIRLAIRGARRQNLPAVTLSVDRAGIAAATVRAYSSASVVMGSRA